MRSKLMAALCLLSLLTFSGCATKDSVLFVTKTSLGIDLDTKPTTANIGYDRVEGYIGPRYQNGAVPPVLAALDSDAKILNPRIQQIYATGDAARNVVDTEQQKSANNKQLTGQKKLMFFGTTTTTGLKIGFTNNLPDSFLFGYKRKEFSFIPLGKEGQIDVYPSVLASIDTGATANTQESTSLNNKQFFATGIVAEALGSREDIRQKFNDKAADLFAIYRDQVQAQKIEALSVLYCFVSVAEEALPTIFSDAHRLGLLPNGSFSHLEHQYNQAVKMSIDDPQRSRLLRKLRSEYAFHIRDSKGTSPTRATLIGAHKELVCTLTVHRNGGPNTPGEDESTNPSTTQSNTEN